MRHSCNTCVLPSLLWRARTPWTADAQRASGRGRRAKAREREFLGQVGGHSQRRARFLQAKASRLSAYGEKALNRRRVVPPLIAQDAHGPLSCSGGLLRAFAIGRDVPCLVLWTGFQFSAHGPGLIPPSSDGKRSASRFGEGEAEWASTDPYAGGRSAAVGAGELGAVSEGPVVPDVAARLSPFGKRYFGGNICGRPGTSVRRSVRSTRKR